MNKLCVIMSVYRGDTLLFTKQAIESILSQTFCNFDFYILKDGPIIKEIEEYLDGLSIHDKRIKVFNRISNKGLAVSLNELLGKVMGDYVYIARMDADDISMPERFAKQVQYLDTNIDIDCVGCWAIEIDEENKEYFHKKMPVTNEACLEFFKKRDCMIHPTVMFRNSFFEKAGLYPEDTYFGEDTMLWANGFANGCKFFNLPEFLFKFRINNNFFSRRRGWRHALGILKLRHRVNKLLHFGVTANFFAFLYFGVKMLPTKLLNLIYLKFR